MTKTGVILPLARTGFITYQQNVSLKTVQEFATIPKHDEKWWAGQDMSRSCNRSLTNSSNGTSYCYEIKIIN